MSGKIVIEIDYVENDFEGADFVDDYALARLIRARIPKLVWGDTFNEQHPRGARINLIVVDTKVHADPRKV